MVAIAGGAVGRVLAGTRRSRLVRWAGPVAVAVLVVALAPTARSRVRVTRNEIASARSHAEQVNRLTAVIKRVGGPAKVKACGQPVSLVGFQSTLAWAVGLNVGNVGFRPGRSIDTGQPIDDRFDAVAQVEIASESAVGLLVETALARGANVRAAGQSA